jgi:hypothetical protein
MAGMLHDMSDTTSLVRWSGALAECRNDTQWQRVWLQVRGAGTWKSITVVPSDPSVSSIDLVCSLVAVGNQLVEGPVVVADLRGVPLRYIEMAKSEVRRRTEAGETVIVAVSTLDESPAALPIARATDAVILGVGLRKTGFFKLRQVVRQVGAKRILGAVSLKERNQSSQRTSFPPPSKDLRRNSEEETG